GHGAKDHRGLFDIDEQGARGHRSALSVRLHLRRDRRRHPPPGHDSCPGGDRRRRGLRPCRTAGHAPAHPACVWLAAAPRGSRGQTAQLGHPGNAELRTTGHGHVPVPRPRLSGGPPRRHVSRRPERRQRGGCGCIPRRPLALPRHSRSGRAGAGCPHAGCPEPRARPGGRRLGTAGGVGHRCGAIGGRRMSGAVGILLFIATLIVMVMIHEAGHMTAARAFGMKVEEYFFGFGPRIFAFRRGETEYGMKAIPAGGYVKIAGMNPYLTVPESDLPRTFGAKPAWQRAIVLSAGSATHFLVAALLLTFSFAVLGVPGHATTTLQSVSATAGKLNGQAGPAEKAGLKPGDRIVAIDGNVIA